MNSPAHLSLPQFEKNLWKSIWKLHTSPKIRHFLWRALSGALAVSDQLRSRGIQVDNTCRLCGTSTETICHTLFSCHTAQQVWRKAELPFPQMGVSNSSVFLNVYHLVACIKRKTTPIKLKSSIPWILWHIWKARNGLIFEKTRSTPDCIVSLAEEEASIWFLVNYPSQDQAPTPLQVRCQNVSWRPPPMGMMKCNVGVSWTNASVNCSVSWIVRDTSGKVLMHSRRSYSAVSSPVVAELWALVWAIESVLALKLHNVNFESSFRLARACLQQFSGQIAYLESSRICGMIIPMLQKMRGWSLDYVLPARNSIALKIAESVTSQHRYQSYVARNGPSWLHQAITDEAPSQAVIAAG